MNYWNERDYRQRSIDNYQGSVYFIQGLQDWNVDSHMIFPLYQQMKDAGFDVKGMFGQWGHDYPDQWQKHDDINNDNIVAVKAPTFVSFLLPSRSTSETWSIKADIPGINFERIVFRESLSTT